MYLRRFRARALAAMTTAIGLAFVGAIAFLPLRAIAGLESPCNFISDLVSTNPLSSDLASTSDDHHRCIKLALKTTFPNVNGAVSATDEQLSQLGSSIFTAATLELENASWRFLFDETDAASNERLYDFIGSSGQLLGRTRTDADGAGAAWLTVDRTGTTVSSIALAATAITLNGVAASDYARLSQSNTFTATNTFSNTNTFTGEARFSSIISPSANGRLIAGEQGSGGSLVWSNNSAAADNKIWDMYTDTTFQSWRLWNDGVSAPAEWLRVTRSGTTATGINLQATAVQANGNTIKTGAFFKIAACEIGSTGTLDNNVAGCTSASRTGTGLYTVGFSGFATTSSCVGMVHGTDGYVTQISRTATSVSVRTNNSAGTATDLNFTINCTGQ